MQTNKQKEEGAIILEFLKNGYPSDTRPSHQKTPIAQAIGKNMFALLELVPKKDVFLKLHEEVYIGEGKREKIHHINKRLKYDELTNTAVMELKTVLKELVKKHEKNFIEFFNKSQPLSTRMHQLELLPRLGKKHMWEILEERKIEPFKDFKDLTERVKLMPDPEKIIMERILKELKGEEKHYVFVK